MLQLRFREDTVHEIGVDEAGRGSFFGPLMAGAVLWPSRNTWTPEIEKLSHEIRDSKKISPKKRERIADDIKRLSVAFAVGHVMPEELDTNGVTWANQEAFRRALAGLGTSFTSSKDRVLIDGELSIHGFDGEQHTIVDGDALFLSIAAASILAKVEHDRWIVSWCDTNSDIADRYALRTSKGYGTAAHRAGLIAHGATALHRRTFIRKYVPDSQSLPKPNVIVKGYTKHTNTTSTSVDLDTCMIRLPAKVVPK
jgi:ribonuclease HII